MKKYGVEVWVGIFVLVCLASVAYLTVKLGKLDILGQDTKTYYADFTSVAGLRKGSTVEMAGVAIGKVDSIALDQDQMMARTSLAIRSDVQIDEDALAAIKTSGLIGDKYIAITPGGSPDMLADGGVIIETQSALDIEELISKYAFGSVEQ